MRRLLIGLVLVGMISGWPAQAGGGSRVRPLAPDVRVTDLSGAEVSLAALRGQAVIVLFGDVRCAACMQDDRLLRRYQFEYVSHGLVVVSLHERASLEAVRRYDAGFTFSLLTGPDPGQAIARRFQVRTLPTTVFIDRGGVIQDVRRGRLTEDQLLRSLQRIL